MSSPNVNSFVKEFQNLHVLSHACDLERMDELVQDLTNALEETICANDDEGSVSVACKKKQRSRQRSRRRPRSVVKIPGNISEASESSIDEAIKDLMDNKTGRHSDSDDLLMTTKRMTPFRTPSSNVLSLAESDSVTENFSPNRPNRRRKRGKRMAVDGGDTDSKSDGQQNGDLAASFFKAMALQAKKDNVLDSNFLRDCGGMLPGKRKRIEQRFVDSCSAACPDNYNGAGTSHMDSACSFYSQVSSCPSSSESDHGAYTNDEGRDADDEHSDFFHEPGPACGVVGIVPWWEQDHDEDLFGREHHFEQILNGTFPFLSKSSKRTFRSRVSRLLAKNREIRASKRRLKERRGLHHYNWLSKEPYSRAELGKKHGLALPCSLDHSVAKYRGTSPPSGRNSCDDSGVVGGESDPIPSNNVGNRMLQKMGWIPGTGLGSSDRLGITTPVVAFKRPKRRGLGATSDS